MVNIYYPDVLLQIMLFFIYTSKILFFALIFSISCLWQIMSNTINFCEILKVKYSSEDLKKRKPDLHKIKQTKNVEEVRSNNDKRQRNTVPKRKLEK